MYISAQLPYGRAQPVLPVTGKRALRSLLIFPLSFAYTVGFFSCRAAVPAWHRRSFPPLDAVMADPSPTDLAQDAQAMYNLLGPQPMALINACFILVTIGQILLNLLLGTLLFSGRVRKRNATLINLLLVSVQVTVPPALLCVSSSLSRSGLGGTHPR